MIVSTSDGPVTTIELQRADKRNALDHAMLADLATAFDDAVAAKARAIVLTGQGLVFCAGADLSGPVYDPDFLTTLVSTLQRIEAVGVPVIAALNGPALGAGLQLAMVADLRVMAPDATCGIPAAKIGVAVDEWTIRRLISLVGAGIARGMLIGCDPLTAQQALTTGFANRIGDVAAAQEWAAQIAELAPLTLAHYKLVFTGDGARDEPAPAHIEAMRAAWRSSDVAEARAARVEKRPPRFTGR